jgi:hypothetical protein
MPMLSHCRLFGLPNTFCIDLLISTFVCCPMASIPMVALMQTKVATREGWAAEDGKVGRRKGQTGWMRGEGRDEMGRKINGREERKEEMENVKF